MTKLLYIDTSNSGMSGDMFLAALLGLIQNPDNILNELKELQNYLSNITRLEIELLNLKKYGFHLNQLKIAIKESKNHRTPKILKSALNDFLDKKEFSESAKMYANNVLNSLFQAEAAVHGELIKKIHLHELSSVDTLLDILGVAKVLDILGGFEKDFKIFCSKLPLGGGVVKSAHGLLPVPAPATSKILEKSDLIVRNGPIESELVTPTGAALIVNLKPKVKPYEMNLKKVAYSTGQKQFKNFLNILSLFYGETKELTTIGEISPIQKYIEPITVLETNVDDISGEILGDFIKNLETENILDIQIIPSTTKKNRPSHLIKVICRPEKQFGLIEKMINQLGTLGVRFNTITRVCIDRKIENNIIEINGKKYELNYKISYIESKTGTKIVNVKPEYEDLKKICEDSGLSVKKIQFYAQAQIREIYFKNKEN